MKPCEKVRYYGCDSPKLSEYIKQRWLERLESDDEIVNKIVEPCTCRNRWYCPRKQQSLGFSALTSNKSTSSPSALHPPIPHPCPRLDYGEQQPARIVEPAYLSRGINYTLKYVSNEFGLNHLSTKKIYKTKKSHSTTPSGKSICRLAIQLPQNLVHSNQIRTLLQGWYFVTARSTLVPLPLLWLISWKLIYLSSSAIRLQTSCHQAMRISLGFTCFVERTHRSERVFWPPTSS
ncbi:hypothetical protein CSKR_100496 [Clonorchis sinensis]|uniref:Uncharacterized protein n=1 Tax=Clonorchis sinensis TaxID=79923 RepID=A0A3R7JX51_CLOSI|nr:hypothetical protein CSKR_100496 [Clonorchis sinensis]